MDWLLYYMYHDDLPKNEIDGDLLIAADKFNVSDLVAICVNYLTANLNENNVVDAMVASYLTNQNELFKDAFVFPTGRCCNSQVDGGFQFASSQQSGQ